MSLHPYPYVLPEVVCPLCRYVLEKDLDGPEPLYLHMYTRDPEAKLGIRPSYEECPNWGKRYQLPTAPVYAVEV